MIIGWDISTSIVGVSVFDDDCNFVFATHIDLRKVDGMLEKAYAAEKSISSIFEDIKKYTNDEHEHIYHFIEDKLSSFSAGKTMQQTLLKLAAFNAVVTFIVDKTCWEKTLSSTVRHIHPSTAKAVMRKDGLFIPKGADKKKLTLDFVSKREKKFVVDKNKNGNPQPWCFDRADAYIVARAGWLSGYLGDDGQAKKASASKESSQAERESSGE